MSEEREEPFVFGPNQTRWLAALEGNEYEQCQGELHKGDGYCCLGIALVVLDCLDENRSAYTLDRGHREEMGLFDVDGAPSPESGLSNLDVGLAALNDAGKSFREIAAAIRANPRAYFKESK